MGQETFVVLLRPVFFLEAALSLFRFWKCDKRLLLLTQARFLVPEEMILNGG